MSALEVPRLTFTELARMMRDAIDRRDYQRESRLGSTVAQYLAWKRLGAKARTLDIYEGYLARLCITLADRDPGIQEVTSEMLLEALSDYPRGSLRLVRTAYSDFFKWACRWGHRDRNPVDLLPPIPVPPMKVYNVFDATEQSKLIAASERLPLPWVQRLRILTLIELGIRSGEARGLQVQHFDRQSQTVVVTGKGGKDRMVPISADLDRALFMFLNRPVPNVRTLDAGGWHREDRNPIHGDHLFFPIGHSTAGDVSWTAADRPLSDRAMRTWWDRVVKTAGVRYRSMHMARHGVGTDLATAGVDSFAIRDWLGHADVSTTQVYVHNSRGRLKSASDRLQDFRKAQGQ